jgi:predicted secreted Zn-dependent protease
MSKITKGIEKHKKTHGEKARAEKSEKEKNTKND